jgi:polyribonucleotide nucleotidyltransferase
MSQISNIINPHGKDVLRVSTELCGKELTLEVNRVGFRSSASVLVSYGDTVVLGTAQLGSRPVKLDYFPLSIDYEEKMYAAGKISGSRFIKREGRPSEEAILIGRIIDRPIRPLWPKGYRAEVQGIATVLSTDPAFRPDMIAMIAVSAALMLTGAPFEGPVAGLRVGMTDDGDYKAFMSADEYDVSKLDLVVAGTKNGVMMVEAAANEATEEEVLAGIAWAQEAMQPAVALQQELADKVGVTPIAYELIKPDTTISEAITTWCEGKLGAKLRKDYPERNAMIDQIREDLHAHFESELGEEAYASVKGDYSEAFQQVVHLDSRKGIVDEQVRPDGRKLDQVRPLSSELGFLPRAHGSSIFTRGVTQAMNIVTLAPLSYAQLVDTMEREGQRRYLHHYNAPGWTVGEVKRLMGPGRREIGHGYLAERALTPVLPSEADFPYVIRSVTEIMSQNGSTSMAATCSSCLALLDAGVPLKRMVSGIAMGLMMDGTTPYVMSDIADAEDFAGDMDFKVTGTSEGITALQMDMKVHGLPTDILALALNQGKTGRSEILKHMESVINTPNEMSPYAPRVETVSIDPDKIREIIGKGGETIQRITAESGTEIDIKDDGMIMIASPNLDNIAKAKQMINDIVAEPEVGTIYYDKPVMSVLDFGAFVQIMPGKDGLVHVSELSDERVEKVTDVVNEGDKVTVKLMAIDDRGRLQLSMKAAKKELEEK